MKDTVNQMKRRNARDKNLANQSSSRSINSDLQSSLSWMAKPCSTNEEFLYRQVEMMQQETTTPSKYDDPYNSSYYSQHDESNDDEAEFLMDQELQRQRLLQMEFMRRILGQEEDHLPSGLRRDHHALLGSQHSLVSTTSTNSAATATTTRTIAR
eukprot:CAMPEP_0194032436 /NCGR_PEP_ID=MMETSP0009_2-20130614/5378_1 /TAXON_ID=210454 /ORGANISM="Grammatophora oceanica, Strain CCMP 410" /LENGTH=154 /DNA_ID=CAMNT_0038672881 /DNA_START=183 /DNA_END=647 /DNA_ORIENTATION=+